MVVEFMNRNIGSIPESQLIMTASLAALVYDYFLTLDYEIERFWKKGFHHQWTWSSFLFFTNRYLTLFGYLPIVFGYAHQSESYQCIIYKYNLILPLLLQVIIISMMLLRIYALYGRRVGIMVFPVIILMYIATIGSIGMIKALREDSSKTCKAETNKELAYYITGTSAGEFVFDITIFVMTLRKVLTLPRGSGSGLLTMIMRDGIVYFGVMVTFNLANLIVLTLAGPTNSAAMINPTNIISSITMTRLTLNLRDPKLIGGEEEFKTTTLNIHGFNGPTRAAMSNDDSRSRSV